MNRWSTSPRSWPSSQASSSSSRIERRSGLQHPRRARVDHDELGLPEVAGVAPAVGLRLAVHPLGQLVEDLASGRARRSPRTPRGPRSAATPRPPPAPPARGCRRAGRPSRRRARRRSARATRRSGVHLAVPALRGVPVVADVVVVEDHRARQRREQPAVQRVGPRQPVEVGVLLEVLELLARRLVEAAPRGDVLAHLLAGLVGVHLVAEEAHEVRPVGLLRAPAGSGGGRRRAGRRRRCWRCPRRRAARWCGTSRRPGGWARCARRVRIRLGGRSGALRLGLGPDLLVVDVDLVVAGRARLQAVERRPGRSAVRAPRRSARTTRGRTRAPAPPRRPGSGPRWWPTSRRCSGAAAPGRGDRREGESARGPFYTAYPSRGRRIGRPAPSGQCRRAAHLSVDRPSACMAYAVWLGFGLRSPCHPSRRHREPSAQPSRACRR